MGHTRCGVVVVGAGPAGAATALALARRGVHVVQLEVGSRHARSPGESLHGVAAKILDELGLWPRFLDQPIRRSFLAEIAWECAEPRERRAIDHAWGPDYHLDRPGFDAWLRAEAARAGAEHLPCAAIDDVRVDHGRERVRYVVRTEQGAVSLESRAVVDATGRSAAITRRLGGRIAAAADRLIAVSKVYDRPLARPSVLIESAEDGWWYSAPLPDNRSVAIWFTGATLARGRAARAEYVDAALHASALTRARFEGFERLTNGASHSVYAAGPSLSVYDRSLPVLPVGDAAAAFDPISGDGLCFALRSALDAAETLAQFFAGHRSALAAYAAGVEAVFMRHTTRRAALYGSVARFGDAPFWRGAIA